MMKISIIIPVKNEEANILRCIRTCIRNCYNFRNIEIIVIDGQSNDKTSELLTQLSSRIKCNSSIEIGKSSQMNYGASLSNNDILLFIHADTELPINYDVQIFEFFNQNQDKMLGIFKGKLRGKDTMLRFTEYYMNYIVPSPHGSHGFFIRKSFWKNHPLNENTDLELYDYLRNECKRDEWLVLDEFSIVGSERFMAEGKHSIGKTLRYFSKHGLEKVKYNIVQQL